MQNETQKFVDMMSHEDIEKLKAVTLYILSKCGATDYIHLFKILYFAEKKHYATYGAHITNDTFIAMEHGPVPSFLYDALKLVTHQETASPNNALWEIAKAVHPGSADMYYYIKGAESPDLDELSQAEIASLDTSIMENKDVSNYYGTKTNYKVRIYTDGYKHVGAGKAVTFKVNGKKFMCVFTRGKARKGTY